MNIKAAIFGLFYAEYKKNPVRLTSLLTSHVSKARIDARAVMHFAKAKLTI